MVKSLALLPVSLIFGGVASFGATPLARVISTEPVAIDWIAAPARNFVPVGLGGDVRSGSASALLQFSDGTSIVLQPNSELRIEGSAGKPVIRVVTGSADYKLSAKSRIRISNPGVSDAAVTVNTVHPGNRVVNDSTGRDGVPTQTSSNLLNAAVMYRASAGQTSGVILPYSPISTGTFLAGNGGQPSFGGFSGGALATGPGGPQIILPNQLQVINLTRVTDPITNITSYTVASITQTVQLPDGTTSSIQITTGTLIGATANIPPPTPNSPNTFIELSFTTTNSTGAQTTLTGAAAGTAIQADASAGVTAAINNKELPINTKPPVITQVLQGGTFSSTAP